MKDGVQASIDLIILVMLMLIGVQCITNMNKIVSERLEDVTIEDKTAIVNKNINTYEKENGLEVYVTYEVLEKIGTNEKIVF